LIESFPKVSIVIPIFNGEKYLDECIKSALDQSYSNIEIIAVDDGSTDNSMKILKDYSDGIKIIQKQNGGTSSALNEGIKQMSGEWFKWLSQDDVLYTNTIEELLKNVNNLEDKKKWITVSNYRVIDSNGNILEEFNQPMPNYKTNFDFNVVLLHHFIGNANTCLIHKSAFENFGLFDESENILPDYELWLRYCLLYNVKINLVPKYLLKYRTHKESFTGSTSEKQWSYLNEYVKKYVLNKLDPVSQKKYYSALKKYTLELKVKKIIYFCLNPFLPKNITKSFSDSWFPESLKSSDIQ
jgi:glycosyltransferase involved in cell wall biosynthesis